MRMVRATERLLIASAAAIALTSPGPAMALVAGGGKDVAKNDDCLIVLEGIDDSDVMVQGKKNVITCEDCDPSCDLDGVDSANGTCTFNLGVNLNEPGIGSCEPAVLKQAKASKKAIRAGLAVPALPLDASAVTGPVNPVVVPTRKKGKKTGKLKVVLSAKNADKPKRKDKDIFVFMCQPRPAGESCPGATTTTTTVETTTTTTMPGFCGDGVLDAGEQCDDGNPDPTDGCTNDCTICGDGSITAPEECDDGPGTCSAGMTGSSCLNDAECDTSEAAGDGVCALANDGTTCAPNCKLPGCGDGLVEPGETCDDGNTQDGDNCPSNCVIAACDANAGSDFSVDVTFAGSDQVAALQLFIDYPEGQVSIPGSGAAVPDGIITDLPGFAFSQVNDLDYAVRESVVDTAPYPQGLVFRIHFETCMGATSPTAGDFSCTVEAAGDANAQEIQGVTCAVAPTP
jgi:cysteine-rich repeat protein